MITVVATIKVQAGQEAKFRQEAEKMIAHVKASEPGTLTYVLHVSNSDPTEFMFFETYKDQESLGAHGASEPMRHFFGAVGGLIDGRPEIKMFTEIAGKK
jgi:quinol monooxygenase YgiN